MTTDNNNQAAQLAQIILTEKSAAKIDERYAKLRSVMLLLAKGSALTMALAMPGTARLLRGINQEDSDWKEWKMFNAKYLQNTIRKLEKQKFVEISREGDKGIVKLTENGRKKVLKFGLESLVISKPERWDGCWTLVFYDVVNGRKGVREQLRHYLGCAGEVRIIFADKIENDQAYRDFFGV